MILEDKKTIKQNKINGSKYNNFSVTVMFISE